ncbi:MAG: AAA family ATPase, partial [Myxococcota bacterium]
DALAGALDPEHVESEGLAESQLMLGAELARSAAGELRPAIVRLVGALQLRRLEGSTRLHLWNDSAFERLGIDGSALRVELGPGASGLGPLIAPPEGRAPLVRHGEWLAAGREYAAELRVAKAVAMRAPFEESAPRGLESSRIALTAEQADAVAAAAVQLLTVIAGGPGTGKTSIVVALLERLLAQGLRLEDVALSAPTGKAADRLRASVAERAPALAAVRATTLHRLLAYSVRQRTFRRDVDFPIPAKVVVVDECSMVDLELFDRLFRAAGDARLVLLGDADQLPSVEAGSVFRDLCGLDHTPIVRRLTKSFRMNAADPAGAAVYTFAEAVRQGEVLGRPPPLRAYEGVEHTEDRRALLDDWHARFAASERFGRRAYRWPFTEADEAEAIGGFDVLQASRLLAMTRRTAAQANEVMHAHTRRGKEGAFSPGDPIIVTSNDYELALFNGDQGVVLRVGGDLSAVFRSAAGFRRFPLALLRQRIELAWCLTVHKSQGSEYERVGVLFDEGGQGSRELVYTAVTRAKRSVTLVGPWQAVVAAAASPLERQCGLAARLAETVR